MVNYSFLNYAIVQYSPLALFMGMFRLGYTWEYAFVGAGLYSCFLWIVLFLLQKDSIDRFLLAIYSFLISGALMELTHLSILERLYDYFQEAMLPLMLCIIGVLTTIMTPVGFIGLELSKNKVIKYSLLLIFASFCSLLFSMQYRGNILLAGVMPFVFLRFFKYFLEQYIIQKV